MNERQPDEENNIDENNEDEDFHRYNLDKDNTDDDSDDDNDYDDGYNGGDDDSSNKNLNKSNSESDVIDHAISNHQYSPFLICVAAKLMQLSIAFITQSFPAGDDLHSPLYLRTSWALATSLFDLTRRTIILRTLLV
jgi:hypothetical protein